MNGDNHELEITDLVDGVLSDSETSAWLAAHPEAAVEVEIARRIRVFMQELRDADVVVPPDFERRLMERVRGNEALLNLLDLWLSGLGQAFLELMDLFFGLLPEPVTDNV